MKTTREDILSAALRLFAQRGFDAVSTSMIAEAVGLTKGALYRHFNSKQGIFDAIFQRMVELDAERANEDHVPEKKREEDPDSYRDKSAHDLCEFVNNQFVFWTENAFASDFRRMVTLEQHKSPERQQLYQDVIAAGPVAYTRDLMEELMAEGKLREEAKNFGAENLALQLFAPLSLMLQLADGGMEHEGLKAHLRALTKEFEERWVC